MKILIRYLLLASLLFALPACSSLFQLFDKSDRDLEEMKSREDEGKIKDIQELYYSRKYREAAKEFETFYTRNPHSRHFLEARMGEAESLFAAGSYKESSKAFRETAQLAQGVKQTEIWANATFGESLSREMLSDFERSLSLLKNLELNQGEISAELGWVQVPARLSFLYVKIGEKKTGEQYLIKARENLDRLMLEKGYAKNAPSLAKVYYFLGFVGYEMMFQEFTEHNFASLIWSQEFLLKALDCDSPYWQIRSKDTLDDLYKKLWNRVIEKKNMVLARNFVNLIVDAENRKPLPSVGMNALQRDFYKMPSEVKENLEAFLFDHRAENPLTEENTQLNSIKREGRVKTEELLPSEKFPNRKRGKKK